MKELSYPLLFKPVYMDYLWGGTRLAELYGRHDTPPVCAESWEIADRVEGMSVVLNGPLRGSTLGELAARAGADLIGTLHPPAPFPLLIKLIDARERLSVQVHPNDETARTYGGHPKTEAWYVLDAKDGAGVYAGLNREMEPDTFRGALINGAVEPLLHWVPVRRGGAVYVPGGCIHAIGAGCLLLEVQQNSNTTCRVYDWGRIGPNGSSRDLHIEEAMNLIDWRAAPPAFQKPSPAGTGEDPDVSNVVSSPYFRVERHALNSPRSLRHTGDSFSALFAVAGITTLTCGSTRERLAPGSTSLIPACCHETTLTPETPDARLLRIRLG